MAETVSSEEFRQAVAWLKAGQRERALPIFLRAVKAHPNQEIPWLYLAQALPTRAQRIAALEQCLKYNPASVRAAESLRQLRPPDAVPPTTPNAMVEISPSPPVAAPAKPVVVASMPRKSPWLSSFSPIEFVLIAVIVLGFVGLVGYGLFFWRSTADSSSKAAAAYASNHVIFVLTSEFDLYKIGLGAVAPQQLTQTTSPKSNPAWSPDGQHIVYVEGEKKQRVLMHVNADGSQPRRLTDAALDANTPSWSPDGKQIVFATSQPRGSSQLSVMAADGSQQRPLTQSADVSYWSPAWSPDGRLIACVTLSYDYSTLVVMAADGTNPRFVMNTRDVSVEPYIAPAWSPDGRSLAFVGSHEGRGLYVVSLEGGSPYLLYQENSINDPAWSPDGRQIVFDALLEGTEDVYAIGPSGGGLTRITHSISDDRFPAWSPDGTQLAYIASRSAGDELYVMNTASTGLTKLTALGAATYPVISPDGKRITFDSRHEGNYEIYTMELANNRLARLTNDPESDLYAHWSPDGSQIVFASARGGSGPNLYVMRADGADVRLLNNRIEFGTYPTWSPDGKTIVFVSKSGLQTVDVDKPDASPRQLTRGSDEYPAWSPDGKQIVYVSYHDDRNRSELYVMRNNGFFKHLLLKNGPDSPYAPSWSPDSKQIAFSAAGGIYLVNADGSQLRLLTDLMSCCPIWAP